MTVVAWARARQFPELPPPEARLFRVADDTQVLAHCYWQRDRRTRPTLLALHGLEGSSGVHYMRGLAAQAWRRGWNAVALNQRNCGGTEHLTPGLYHSGLTADPRAVLRTLHQENGLAPFVVAGYSLGGNLAIRLAGELDEAPDLPLCAVAAVCPTIDLDRCVHALERRRNIAYQFNFVRNLRARMRRKDQAWPRAFDLAPLGSTWTIRRFDEIYTAPHHGFAGASDYYFRASALRVVDRIRIPTLILAADDDPFVPADQFRSDAIRANPWITVRVERHGGHCGFIAPANGTGDGYWAEETAVGFLAAAVQGAAMVNGARASGDRVIG
jgi:predicted alpha/beta-fold hydrolase